MNQYLSLLKKHPRYFLFSIGGIFFSAPGQTFLISLFIQDICNGLNISEYFFASIYSSGTLFASFCLYHMGKKIDTWPTSKLILTNTCFFSLALLLLSISQSYVSLFFAIFFMRLFGQGVLTITATASTIKLFNHNRASALSLTQLGYPLSEFLFPTITIFLLGFFGWRATFICFSLIILLGYLPLMLFGAFNYKDQLSQSNQMHADSSLAIPDVLKDRFFPIYLALSSIPPIMMTAALYFQVTIYQNHLWSIQLISISIFLYALSKFCATLIIGPIIDKFGIIFPFWLLIFCIGLATYMISISGTIYISYCYYALFGIGVGISASTMSYLWALLYGSTHIGEIKGFIGIIRNGGTAVTPITFSWLLSFSEISIDLLFKISGLIIIAMSFGPFILQSIDERLHRRLSSSI